MSREAIERNVNEVLMEHFDVTEEALAPMVQFEADLGADSLEFVDTQFGIERKMGITLPDRLLNKTSTVGELYDLVEEVINADD